MHLDNNQPLALPHPVQHRLYKYKAMILLEIYQQQRSAYQDVAQDNSQPQIGDLRKSRLTLRQLNKLRKMNDVRAYEYKEKLKLVRQQYSPPAAPPV